MHPQPSRRQRVAPLIELRIQNGGNCWTTIRECERRHLGQPAGGGTGSSNAPARHFQFCFATPDLQSGNWIISLSGPAQAVVAGVGVAPTKAEVMSLA
jgi:hypothetical protein